MIFGFNTDIRHEDTVYHVQSEAREGEQLLQTQVFVQGRCIGKRAVSYAAAAKADDAPGTDQNQDQQRERMLRDQFSTSATRRKYWPQSKSWICSGSIRIPYMRAER
jgi:hypothetical protein